VKPLRHTVGLGDGETPASFAARLAAANGVSAREFCLDFRTQFQHIVDGKPAALSIVAAKGAVPAADLAANAFVRLDGLAFEHRGEQLTRSHLRRKRVAICPACLSDDIARADKQPRLAAYGRAIWQIGTVDTCPIHGTALAIIADDLTPSALHDFVHHVSPVLADLDRLAEAAAHRQPTSLQAYVLARLRGERPNPFLDSLALFVAIEACETIGAVEMFGPKARLKSLSEDDWRTASATGFAIAGDGAAGIQDFLRRLQATFAYNRSGNEKPRAFYGHFYQWLEAGKPDAAYGPLRDLVGQHIRSHLPMAAGDMVFGREVGERTLHSIRSLSLETGQHPKRLRKVLTAAGIVPPGSEHLADANIAFDAAASFLAVGGADGALSRPQVERYLNAPRVPTHLIVKNGFIKPVVSASGAGASDKYTRIELDAFLARLTVDTRPVRKPLPNQAGIAAAAKRACCSAVEILRLILDRNLDWVGRLEGERGYLSVLVDVEEVRAKLKGKAHGGLTPAEVSKMLGIGDGVARALMAHGHLKTFTAINPINHCPQAAVRPAEVRWFRAKYVSLFALAKQQGRHFLKVKQELDARGVKPALDVNKIGATFYRRKDC
jgi:hypothetical protein